MVIVRHMVLWSGISAIPHSRQVCMFSLRYISASRYVKPYRSFTSRAMTLLAGSNGGLPVRLLRHVGGALSRTSLTVERNSRRVIPSMVNSPSQPFRTKHLIWFRDRAPIASRIREFSKCLQGYLCQMRRAPNHDRHSLHAWLLTISPFGEGLHGGRMEESKESQSSWR